VRKGDDLTTFIVPKVEKILEPQEPRQACSGKPLPFTEAVNSFNNETTFGVLLGKEYINNFASYLK
jgi:hypothetical protein